MQYVEQLFCGVKINHLGSVYNNVIGLYKMEMEMA